MGNQHSNDDECLLDSDLEGIAVDTDQPGPNLDQLGKGLSNVVDILLHSNETVSMIFLLYDEDESKVLEQILKEDKKTHTKLNVNYVDINKCPSYNGPVINWVCRQRSDWKMKLIEALTIIQNYQVPKLLGIGERDLLQSYFKPSDKKFSLKVNKIKKLLFLMADDIPQHQWEQITKEMNKTLIDDGFTDLEAISDLPKYPEVDILYWISKKLLKKNDYTPLIFALNNVGLSEWAREISATVNGETLEKVLDSRAVSNPPTSGRESYSRAVGEVSSAPSSERISSISATISPPPFSARISLPAASSNISPPSTSVIADDRYFIDPNNPGTLLIINQEKFAEKEYSRREGSGIDCNSLKETFELLNFKVKVKTDLSATEMKSFIKQEAGSPYNSTMSTFAVAVLSHGKNGCVIGSDCKTVGIEEIRRLTCSQKLNGKPKILIIQACLGEDHIKSEASASEDIAVDAPDPSDSMMILSTVEGYVAYRSKVCGSIFVQELCKMILQQGGEKDLATIASIVGNVLKHKVLTHQGKLCKVIPETRSTCFKKIFLEIPEFRKQEAKEKILELQLKEERYKKRDSSAKKNCSVNSPEGDVFNSFEKRVLNTAKTFTKQHTS